MPRLSWRSGVGIGGPVGAQRQIGIGAVHAHHVVAGRQASELVRAEIAVDGRRHRGGDQRVSDREDPVGVVVAVELHRDVVDPRLVGRLAAVAVVVAEDAVADRAARAEAEVGGGVLLVGR